MGVLSFLISPFYRASPNKLMACRAVIVRDENIR